MSRSFIAENEDVSTVVCAPVYSEILGLATEVPVGIAEGLPKPSAVRCDSLCLMFKSKLTHYVGSLGPERVTEMGRALSIALEIEALPTHASLPLRRR